MGMDVVETQGLQSWVCSSSRKPLLERAAFARVMAGEYVPGEQRHCAPWSVSLGCSSDVGQWGLVHSNWRNTCIYLISWCWYTREGTVYETSFHVSFCVCLYRSVPVYHCETSWEGLLLFRTNKLHVTFKWKILSHNFVVGMCTEDLAIHLCLFKITC